MPVFSYCFTQERFILNSRWLQNLGGVARSLWSHPWDWSAVVCSKLLLPCGERTRIPGLSSFASFSRNFFCCSTDVLRYQLSDFGQNKRSYLAFFYVCTYSRRCRDTLLSLRSSKVRSGSFFNRNIFDSRVIRESFLGVDGSRNWNVFPLFCILSFLTMDVFSATSEDNLAVTGDVSTGQRVYFRDLVGGTNAS